MPRLILLADDARQVLNLESDLILIGRADDCEVTIDDKRASRHHAKIVKEGGRFVIEDLDSRNGTEVNGRSIDRCTLLPGDRITIGSLAIFFESEPKDDDEESTGTDLDLITIEPAEPVGPPGRTEEPSPEPISAPPCLFVLTDSNGNLRNFEVPFAKLQQGITLGRSRENDVSIPDDGVSSEHLRVAFTGGSFLLTDLGSTNGTRINGKLSTGAIIKTGDLIEMGAVRIDFFSNATEASFDKDSFQNLERFLVEDPRVRRRRSRWRKAAPALVLIAGTALCSLGLLALARWMTGPAAPHLNLIHAAARLATPTDFDHEWRREAAEGRVTYQPTDDGGTIRFQLNKSDRPHTLAAIVDRPIPFRRGHTYRFTARVTTDRLIGAAALRLAWYRGDEPVGHSVSPVLQGSTGATDLELVARPPAEADRVIPSLSVSGGGSGSANFRALELVAEPSTDPRPTMTVADTRLRLGATVGGVELERAGSAGGKPIYPTIRLIGIDTEDRLRYSQSIALERTMARQEDGWLLTGRMAPLTETDRPVAYRLRARLSGGEAIIEGTFPDLPASAKTVRWGFVLTPPVGWRPERYELYNGSGVVPLDRTWRSGQEIVTRSPEGKLSLQCAPHSQLRRPPHGTTGLGEAERIVILPPVPNGADPIRLRFVSGDSQLDRHLESELASIEQRTTDNALTEARKRCKDLTRKFAKVAWAVEAIKTKENAVEAEWIRQEAQAQVELRQARQFRRPVDLVRAESLYRALLDPSRTDEPKKIAQLEEALGDLEKIRREAPWLAWTRWAILERRAARLRDAGQRQAASLIETFLRRRGASDGR